MKIGILTLHAQVNYGAILQCWALQEYLTEQGHDVVVLDRWGNAVHHVLTGPYRGLLPWRWCYSLARLIMRHGGVRFEIRRYKTRRFIKRVLKLSSFHFRDWSDAPKTLGVDCLVIGSDQVFNYYDDPDFFLLEGAPRIKAICYAVSFGNASIPIDLRDKYVRGLSRFSAISCRENEGASVCKDLGFSAVQVCDPTLLVPKLKWEQLIARFRSGVPEDSRPRLACYIIDEGQDMSDFVSRCSLFAARVNGSVEIFYHNYSSWRWQKRLPRARGVTVHLSQGPDEFLSAISTATWVISNSFHGLMFSAIFGCNVRMLSPFNQSRIKMFARIREFESYSTGKLVVADLAEALNSFVKQESVVVDLGRLKPMKSRSCEFIKQNLPV